LSFFEIEGIVKKYGYKSGDLLCYLEPGCSMQSGLKLISSDYDVLGMVDAHKGVLVIELYFMSFDEHADNDDEYEDDNDGENSRIDWDDPYWEEVFELDLFDEDNNPPRPSMVGAMLRRVMRVMGRVMREMGRMRVRMGKRRVMRQWIVIIKLQMQRGLKERVEGVDVMVMRLVMMM
jgi:hypothetical protein